MKLFFQLQGMLILHMFSQMKQGLFTMPRLFIDMSERELVRHLFLSGVIHLEQGKLLRELPQMEDMNFKYYRKTVYEL